MIFFISERMLSESVNKLVGGFKGSNFDSMSDMNVDNGKPYINDYLFLRRKISDEVFFKMCKEVCEDYGIEYDVDAVDSYQKFSSLRVGSEWVTAHIERIVRDITI